MLPVYMCGLESKMCDSIAEGIRAFNTQKQSDGGAALFRLEYICEDDREMIRLAPKVTAMSVFFIGVHGSSRADLDRATAVRNVILRTNRDHYVIYVLPSADLLIDLLPDMLNISGVLLRPFDEKQLFRNLGKINDDYNMLNMTDDGQKSPFVALRYLGSIVRLRPDEIQYVEAQDKKLQIHRPSRELAIYDKMENIKSKLGNRFFHCHRSYLVNCDAIYRIDLPRMEIELFDGTMIPISRTYRQQAKALQQEMEQAAAAAQQ